MTRRQTPPESGDENPSAATDLRRLIDLVARLRAPDGCPWDRRQQLADLRSYLIEEAHEAAAAIDGGDPAELAGELGDLLFQVAFILRLAEEAGDFDAAAPIDAALAKMIARHPHVFGPRPGESEKGEKGEGEELTDVAAVKAAWERRKLAEEPGGSLLGGIARSLPPLTAAYRMTQKAAGVGFDWPDPEAVIAKLEEEVGELRRSLEEGDRPGIAEEAGDLLFTAVNLARKVGVDPDSALAATNGKFRRRFEAIEQGLAERGERLGEASLDTLEELWQAAKKVRPDDQEPGDSAAPAASSSSSSSTR